MSLVILLGSLDRCKPEKAIEALEMVQYLQVSGDCIVIAAFDYDTMLENVAAGVEKLSSPSAGTPLEQIAETHLKKIFRHSISL